MFMMCRFLLAGLLSGCGKTAPIQGEPVTRKPVIYLYPEEETQVTVNLDFDGKLTSTYPAYGDGWTVTVTGDSAKVTGSVVTVNGSAADASKISSAFSLLR